MAGKNRLLLWIWFWTAFIIAIAFYLISCHTMSNKTRLGPAVDSRDHNINIWTHNLSSKMYSAVEYSAKIIREEVFADDSSCPTIVVRQDNTDEFRPSINIYDSTDAPGMHFNACAAPYAAVAKNGSKAVINLCGQRLVSWWAHALDPDIYLVTHNLARVLGLPKTSTVAKATSYTANDRAVRTAFSFNNRGLMFRFNQREVAALRSRYCFQ